MKKILIFSFFLLSVVRVHNAHAALLLDQLYEISSKNSFIFASNGLAQTFTVNITGKLERVSLKLANKNVHFSPSKFYLLPVSEGTIEPDFMNSIAEHDVRLNYGENYRWYDIYLNEYDIQVVKGDVLALALAPRQRLYWQLGDGRYDEDYLGGSAYKRVFDVLGDKGLYWRNISRSYENDLNFRTFVEPRVESKQTAVPEPATIFLLGSGLLGLAFKQRKRQ